MPRSAAEWITAAAPAYRFKGQDWPVLFTHRAMLLAERVTGLNTLGPVLARPDSRALRGLFYAALESAGAELSLNEAGAEIGRNQGAARHLIARAWVASMPEPRPAARQKEPSSPAKKQKAIGWIDCWASARYDLHLDFEEWLGLTPRMLRALQEARLLAMQRAELLNGMLAATIENFSQCRPDKPTAAQKFMLHPFDESEEFDPLDLGDHIMAQMSKMRKTSTVAASQMRAI
jgi:hypothetical protein